jgi:cation:H+ antiporter
MHLIPDNIFVYIIVLLISFYILAKSADFLVDGAVGIAFHLHIPKIIIGIVLVSFATTSPEFTVSLISAVRGFPEIALGNAVGSVIVNTGVAISFAAIIAAIAGDVIHIDKQTLITTGLFLEGAMLLAFIFGTDGTISRMEGIILLGCLGGYLGFLVVNERRKAVGRTVPERQIRDPGVTPESTVHDLAVNPYLEDEVSSHTRPGSLLVQFLRFGGGVLGVVVASQLLVESAVGIAHYLSVPEVVIGLTVIAIGTSLPEIATCVIASKKGHGDLAFGDIVGANILNILWIVGAAATANPITVGRNVIFYAFPVMIFMVTALLLLARVGYRLKRSNGVVLIGLYLAYLVATILIFYFG